MSAVKLLRAVFDDTGRLVGMTVELPRNGMTHAEVKAHAKLVLRELIAQQEIAGRLQ